MQSGRLFFFFARFELNFDSLDRFFTEVAIPNFVEICPVATAVIEREMMDRRTEV